MWLQNISLLNFKNYSDIEVNFSPTVNALVGNNGAGKTNLLDAIHYLCLCKSYFNPIDSQQIKMNEDLFLIQGLFDREHKNEKITCGLKRNHKKQFKRNKKDYDKLANHIGLFPLVMISPYDASLILEGSEERRKFIDNVISQTDAHYLEELMIYNKHLSNRNALLKQAAVSHRLDEDLLQIYNHQLVVSGQVIFEKRKAFMLKFIPFFNQHYKFLTQNSEQVGLEYQSQLEENAFENLLKQALPKDKILERTTVGIHKDELTFTINNLPLKKNGSQGQQKSFLIALKLAQYSYLIQFTNQKPLLLLDDIFDKLDDNRIQKLMQMVSTQDFGQIFITDTNKKRVETIFKKINVDIMLFEVLNGTIKHA